MTALTEQTEQRWGSRLDSVVVYAQGAVCRRLARGGVPPTGRVRVGGLPRSLDTSSLRARVLGSSSVRVTEARIEVEAEVRGPETLPGLRREVERLNDVCEAARELRDGQLRRIEEVAALRPVPPSRRREDPHRRTPVEAWLELADFVDERLAALHTRLAESEEELRRAEHELELAVDRFERASTDAPSGTLEAGVTAVLTLAGADVAAEVEVELEYRVPGATWVPAYRLTHRQGDDGGGLTLRASVAQRTGEDWTGARIGLSTADLRRRTDLPKLRSLRIGRRQPVPAPSGWREPPAGLADLFTGYDAAGPPPSAQVRWAAGAGAPMPPPSVPVAVGAVPEAFGGPAPAAPPAAPAAAPRLRSAAALAPSGGAPMPAAPGGPAAPPPPGPPQPADSDLDYAALVLRGPQDSRGRRGRLFAGDATDLVAAEYRRRAESVVALPLPAYAVRPRESAGSFDHRFDAAATADIPSDGRWHTVTIGELPVGLRTEYVCVPSVEAVVYATLVLSNGTDQALLAGPVEVAVDGEFLLTAALPTVAPGGHSRMGLGPAEGIRVARRTELRESTAGLRGSTTVLDHRVHVELANRLARPVRVEVRERVPVSSDPDVRIEEHADWTAPPQDGRAPEHHAPSTRLWRVELPPGGNVALDGGYEIRIPAGKALVGGNRRS